MATNEGMSPKKLEKKAAAKEEIVNATSGAREIVDHAVFNARAVGKMMLHPFDKEKKAGAIATAREDKTASGQKMSAIRQAGAQQANAMRSMARGEDSPGSLPRSEDAGEGDGLASNPASSPVSTPASTPATREPGESGERGDVHTASDTLAEPVSGDRDRV